MKDDPPIEFDREQFLRDRHDMLLALDVPTMREYARKYGARVPLDNYECYYIMHLARLGERDLPKMERQKSREWLKTHDIDGRR